MTFIVHTRQQHMVLLWKGNYPVPDSEFQKPQCRGTEAGRVTAPSLGFWILSTRP